MPHKISIRTQEEPMNVLTFLGRLEDYVRLSLKKFLELEIRNKNLTVKKVRGLIEDAIINPKFDWNQIK